MGPPLPTVRYGTVVVAVHCRQIAAEWMQELRNHAGLETNAVQAPPAKCSGLSAQHLVRDSNVGNRRGPRRSTCLDRGAQQPKIAPSLAAGDAEAYVPKGDSNARAALAALRTSIAALSNHQVLQVTILRRAHAALRVLAAALGNQRLLLVLQIKILRRQPCKARWKSIVSTRRRFPLRLKLIGDLHAVFLH